MAAAQFVSRSGPTVKIGQNPDEHSKLGDDTAHRLAVRVMDELDHIPEKHTDIHTRFAIPCCLPANAPAHSPKAVGRLHHVAALRRRRVAGTLIAYQERGMTTMQRVLCFRTPDKASVLFEEPTLAFRLTPGCERGAAELGVSAGSRVRVELLDDAGHLLDSRTYLVPPTVE